MYNKRNKNLNPGSGFTLIEILIVVVIITVISGAILSLINSEGLRGKSRDAQRVADIKKTQSALELYFADNRQYPDTSSDKSELADISSFLSSYMSVTPTDPLNTGQVDNLCGNSAVYKYVYQSDGSEYYLGVNMEDSRSAEPSPCTDFSLFCNSAEATCYAVRNP